MRKGIPSVSVDLMIASLSNNTIKQYNTSFKLWWQFCSLHNIDIFSESVNSVVIFLTEQFEKGASYSTINTHRSALSLLIGNNIGSNESIKRLLKGVFKLRPARPKYNSTWDPQMVLNYISAWYPNSEISLEKLTKKVVILLALCTGHRIQTFSLIKIDNISFTTKDINIFITDLIKTSAPGRESPLLSLPYFTENPNVCPAKTIQDYLERTRDLRPMGVNNLLITHKKPYKSATTQSISRWIKQVLSESGVDTSVFSAHSTRHASTSAAAAAGVSIDTIRRTAGWTQQSNTFAKYYNRKIISYSNFANYMIEK